MIKSDLIFRNIETGEIVDVKGTIFENLKPTKKFAYGGLIDDKKLQPISIFEEDISCGHTGCLNHITHPCENCGRIGGHNERTKNSRHD